MTSPLTKGHAPSSALIHLAISASQSEKNHWLGRVNGEMQLDFKYPGWMKCGDEDGKAIKGDLISYIRPDLVAATQYDWFAPKTAAGLTKAGLSRINQSIEVFVYCILGAQVNVRSSILREGGKRLRRSS